MYIRKPNPRAWAVIPAIVLVVAISVIAGPADAATYTAQVPLGAARPFAVLAVAAVTAAVQIPVAAPLVPRLLATSTSDESGPPMLLGFLLGLIGVLVIFVWRKSVAAGVINIFTR